MLADLSPKFFAYARLKVKHPVFLEALEAGFADGAYRLKLTPLQSALNRFKDHTETVIFGVEPGFLANEDEIKSELQEFGDVLTVTEALEKAKKDLERAWSS